MFLQRMTRMAEGTIKRVTDKGFDLDNQVLTAGAAPVGARAEVWWKS